MIIETIQVIANTSVIAAVGDCLKKREKANLMSVITQRYIIEKVNRHVCGLELYECY